MRKSMNTHHYEAMDSDVAGVVDNVFSIIKLDSFILATRDSGYKGTNSAIAELIDNSIQARSTKISITITPAEDAHFGIEISVLDNGSGMESHTLRQALRFGGSSRFNDRTNLGRFGMGLPNSSLSQSRRVEVYTWARLPDVWHSYIDVDEIASGKMIAVPEPNRRALPSRVNAASSGTLVCWSRCDRLDNRRISTLHRKLLFFLGRVFRFFLWDGIKIFVNDTEVEPVDPLYLNKASVTTGASQFGETLNYSIQIPSATGSNQNVGNVIVRFSELPVHRWQHFPNEKKQEMGITKGAGVSVVRANREIDYGWFFMNGKRKENYDDWWRCEVKFEPVLDEAFGITHTKQQIRPQEYLSDILCNDLTELSRSLNNRVRQAHLELKLRKQSLSAANIATANHSRLRPLPSLRASSADKQLLEEAEKSNVKQSMPSGSLPSFQYNILHKKLSQCTLYSFSFDRDRFVLNLNPEHPFYKTIYKPLNESDSAKDLELCERLELLLLAAARSEAMVRTKEDRRILEKHRLEWSNVFAILLNGSAT